jgi:hypothetical protein
MQNDLKADSKHPPKGLFSKLRNPFRGNRTRRVARVELRAGISAAC